MKAPGGGVCQVSTTVFRAILDSGFPVLERHAHSYVVSYYGAGLDATIYYPNKDLIFLNDSSYPIEIRASVSGTSLTISFYGVHDGRKGEVGIVSVYGRTKPLPTRYEYSAVLPKGTTKCREIPRYGMSASVLTSIEYPGESTEQKQYKSTYAPWGTVCTIGTKK